MKKIYESAPRLFVLLFDGADIVMASGTVYDDDNVGFWNKTWCGGGNNG